MRFDTDLAERGAGDQSGSGPASQSRSLRLIEPSKGRSTVDFLVRRFSPGETMGLHLTVGVAVTIAAITIFVLLACAVSEQSYLTVFDRSLAESLHEHAQANPGLVMFFRPITALGSQVVLLVLAILIALTLSLRGRRALSRAWLAIMAGGLLHSALKPIVPRLRPQFENPFVMENSLSFPSGHAMASLIGYGLMAYLLWLALPRGRMRIATAASLFALIIGIGFSRLYLGAHYLSDVLGGYAAGTAWLMASICGIEAVRRSRKIT